MYLDDALTAIEQFEGRVNHLYLDPKGNVTVGVGQLVPSAGAAEMMSFQISDESGIRAASMQEIAADYDRVNGSRKGFRSAYYYWPRSVFLTGDAIDAMLRKVVTGIDSVLPNIYPGYRLWPDSAKVAVLDMGYNLGVEGLGQGYPKMNAALNGGDFVGAAKECIREPGDEAFAVRNEWTVNQFLEAAKGERR